MAAQRASACGAAYARLHRNGQLLSRVEEARRRLAHCELCPGRCGVDRTAGHAGRCQTGRWARVASYHGHFGEEPPLVGRHGSGTIFFSGCNLHCCYCQNHEISQRACGDVVGPEQLATIMLELQDAGCHNVNLVSPSHVVPQILEALLLAAESGLRVPLVYNTGGYDDLDTLRLLDGVVDIYMPDMKYGDEETGRRFSGVAGYPAVNQAAVGEMFRQVGNLAVDEFGVARRGLLVRHLVLPNGLAGTDAVCAFLAEEVSLHVYVNIMDQYRPCYLAARQPLLSRPVTRDEYRHAVAIARMHGLTRFDAIVDQPA